MTQPTVTLSEDVGATEAAQLLGVHRATVLRRIERSGLGRRVPGAHGGTVVIRRSDLPKLRELARPLKAAASS